MNKLDWYTKEKWITGQSAMDAAGNDISATSQYAVKFDLYSAFVVSYGNKKEMHERMDALKMIAQVQFKDKLKGLPTRPGLCEIADQLTYEETKLLINYL